MRPNPQEAELAGVSKMIKKKKKLGKRRNANKKSLRISVQGQPRQIVCKTPK
jgi:hypothetical protein